MHAVPELEPRGQWSYLLEACVLSINEKQVGFFCTLGLGFKMCMVWETRLSGWGLAVIGLGWIPGPRP